jgi:predicted nicotinamide N-methyase
LGLCIAQTCQMYQVTNSPRVVLTDLKEALPLIKSNQQLNNIDNVDVQTLKWGVKQNIDQVLDSEGFNTIFVSDVLYNTCDFQSLINTLRQLTFERKDTAVYLGYKPRGLKISEERLFFNECKVYFNIEPLTVETFIQEFDGNNTSCDSGMDILEETGVCLYKLVRK